MLRTILFLALALAPIPGFAADLARLTPENWDEMTPRGKEVDCIYGDYVLRNDRLIAVIAEPLATRNANMTVRSVGALILDLTRRNAPNDQLSCYYCNGMPLQFTNPDTVKLSVDGKPLATTPDARGSGRQVEWQATTTSASGLEVTIRYELNDGQDWIKAESRLRNPKDEPITQEISDLIRADRSFTFGEDADSGLFWADDEFFQQGYGVLVEGRRLIPSGSRNNVLRLADNQGKSSITVKPGETFIISRQIFPGSSLLEVRSIANQIQDVASSSVAIHVADPNGPVANAKVTVQLDGKSYASGRTNAEGTIATRLPAGKATISAEAVGRKTVTQELAADRPNDVKLNMDACGYVVAKITDVNGGPIPCKVAFHGKDGTATPDFAPDSADTAVKNLYYSHQGTFRQELGPGKYQVMISYGPEYDAVFTEIEVTASRESKLDAQLKRVVDTKGWISSDFHSHSSPSGDNTSSQLGRVQSLLCEHVEFCPCTEHNRIDSYVPLLKQLGVEHLMATCAGMELTGQLLPVNHQNAFPLVHKPRTQDGGGPTTDGNPVVQIERLAMWDGGSDKLVQENHPNLVQILTDKDEDGKFDGGFAGMLKYMDVIEVHPLQTIFTPPTRGGDGKLSRNPIFHWMQMLNLGYRIPGVVNTDAHYNFHESGWLRNYLRSATDDPAQVDVMDMVHASELGHVVMTTGPFMEVSMKAKQASTRAQGIPGDDVVAPGGEAELSVRVQCPNWFDINRVQVFLNGRPAAKLNFTRRENPDRFQNGVVKFDAKIPIAVQADTHVIVAAIGEGLGLGPIMGPERGKQVPIAVSNPIFLDLAGDGFQPNGDLLDLELPKS